MYETESIILKYSGTYSGKTKNGFDKRGNKRSDMVLYVLQTFIKHIIQKLT